MNMLMHSCVAGLCLVLLVAPSCTADHRHQRELPANSEADGSPWPGVGHDDNLRGGGSGNAFDRDFDAAGNVWTPELCAMDSDGDGFTNGQELGDPSCTWQRGQPQGVALAHPGLGESVP